MQRSNKPRWKKIGGGSLTLRNGMIIHSGETFRAGKDEIPQAFRDVVQQLDSYQKSEPSQSNLVRVHHKGGGWYDLIDSQTGEAINSDSMRQQEANQYAGMTVEQVQKQFAANKDDDE